jgi:hypothetical protein
MKAMLVVVCGLAALLVVATLVIGSTCPVSAEGVTDTTYFDDVETEVIESYPEASVVQPELIDPVASGGALVHQPPQANWDRVVGSACAEPESFCSSLP